jgi:TP901 family phage tail tape measure protein
VSDDLFLKLDGSEIIKGVESTLTALAELKAAITSFGNNDPTGRVRAEVQALSTSAVTVVDTIQKTLGGIKGSIEKATNEAATTGRAGGKKVGQSIAAGFADGLEDGEKAVSLVRQQVKALQEQYEKAVSAGWRVKPLQLQELKAQGVSLVPDDRLRLEALVKDQQTASRQVLAMRRSETEESIRIAEADRAGYLRMLDAKVAANDRALKEVTAANLTAYQQDLAGYQQMLKLRVEAARVAAREISAANLNSVGSAAKALLNNMPVTGEAYSVVKGAKFGTLVPVAKDETDALKANTAAAKEAADAKAALKQRNLELAEAKRVAAQQSRELHSALRGVSGAAGALFLTYGSLIPLAAAFFSTSAAKQALQAYKDLEYQLKFVQAIAEDSTLSVATMMAAISKTAASTGTAPTEAAKGMRILAQAGLTAQQSLDALPDVLKVATVGEIDMARAAEVLTGSTYAFGIGLDSIGRVGDVFVKAAAISNTSVGSIAESMKQASTVSQQYRLSVEDVGTALVALGKRNIIGSAAGTAFRNLMDELAAPRGESKQIARQLGVSLFDPLKNDAKDFFDRFVPELRAKLKQFDPESQTYILNRLTNNRGGKAMAAILGMDDAALAEIRGQLEKAQGMTSRALIELNDSVQGDLNKLKASLEGGFARAASSSADPLRDAMQRLREVVGSEGFANAIRGLAGSLAILAEVLSGVTKFLTSDAGLVAGLVALGGLILPRVTATGATAAASIVGVGEAAAVTGAATAAAASGAAGLLATFAKFTVWTAAISAAIIGLGLLYEKMSEKDPVDKALSYTDSLIRKEKEYGEQLDDSITKLQRRLGLASAPTKSEIERQDNLIAASRQVQDDYKRYQDALNRAGLTEAQYVEKLKGTSGASGAYALSEIGRARAALDNSSSRYKDLVDKDTNALRLQQQNNAKSEGLRGLQAKVAEEERKKLDNALGGGTNHFNQISKSIAGADYQNALRETKQEIAKQEQLAAIRDEAYRVQEATLKYQYQTGVMDFRDYQEALTALQSQQAMDRIKTAQSEVAQLQKAYDELPAKVEEKARAAAASAEHGRENDAANTVRQQGELDRQDLERQIRAAQMKSTRVVNDNYLQQLQAQEGLLKPYSDLVRSAEKEGALLQNNFNQEMARLRVKENAVLLSEREQYIQAEILKSTNAMEDRLAKLLADREQLTKTFDFSASDVPQAAASDYQRLSLVIIDLQQTLKDARATARGVADEAFDAKKINEIAKGLNEGLSDAIVNAGHDGGQRLRDVLQQELLRKPFKMAIQALLQPVTQAMASTIWGAIGGNVPGGQAAGGIGSTLSTVGGATSLASLGSTMSTAYTAGSTSVGVMAGSVGGGGGVMGGVASALGTIPVAGWVALAALAAYSIFGGKGGGPKSESGFMPRGMSMTTDPAWDHLWVDGKRGKSDAAKQASESISQSFENLANQLGIIDRRLGGVGVFWAADPEGDAETQLQIASKNYNRGNLMGGIENVGRDEDALKTAVTESTADLMLTEVKARITGKLKTYFDTLDPLKLDADQINSAMVMAAHAQTLWKAFDELGGALARLSEFSVEAVDDFAKASGGFEQLAAQLTSYASNYYTAQEKRDSAVASITKALNGAGVNVSSAQVSGGSRTQFRDLLNSYDATTESGRQAITALLGVADAFASITRSADDILTERQGLERQLLELQENTVELRRRELETLDPSNQALQQRIWSLEDEQAINKERKGLETQLYQALGDTVELRRREREALDETNRALYDRINAINDARSATDSAYSQLQRLVKRDQDALRKTAEAAQKTSEKFKPIFEMLRDEVKALYDQVADMDPEAHGRWGSAFISDALAAVNAGGDFPDKQDLQDAITAARKGMDDRFFNSAFEAKLARLTLAGDLSQLRDKAGQKYTEAEKLQQTAEDQLDALDAILTNARDQIDTLRGVIDPSIVSVKEAIDLLTAALLGERSVATGTPTERFVDTPYGREWTSTGGARALVNASGLTVTGRTGNQYTGDAARAWVNQQLLAQDPSAVYGAAIREGISAHSLDALMGWAEGTSNNWARNTGVPAFAGGGWHDGGWAMVGEEGPELAYMPPAHIYTAPDTRRMTGEDNTSSTELRALREENRVQALALAQLNTRMVKLLEQWETQGMPVTRTT